MEPVTHLLTGACLSRAGFNRRAAYATLTMAIAAEFPDIDTLWSLRGPVEGFTHHRGITHTFLGLPFEAALIVGGVYGWHRWRLVRNAKKTASQTDDLTKKAKPLTVAPVRWGLLYLFALAGLLSHLLLDYTNNYGIRPFFPFDRHWYAASIVFIFDPAIFGLLLLALVLPAVFGLVGAEMGAKRAIFRGRGLAIAALMCVVGLWCVREFEHGQAVTLAMGQTIAAPDKATSGSGVVPTDSQTGPTDARSIVAPTEAAPTYLEAQRALASPDPLNPWHWSTATDFGPLYQLAEVDLRAGSLTPDERVLFKPDSRAAFRVAEASPVGRAYFDWSPMPVLDADLAEDGTSVVTFSDPRFMGGWMHDMGRTALTGSVVIDAKGQVVEQALDGRAERVRP